jgi:ABC-type transport system involved in multi-copper enzyme maturation permease subunit
LLDVQANSQHFINTFFMCSLFAWAFLSIGFMVSAATSERGKVIMAVAGLGLLMYVATALSGLKDGLQWLKNLSFFSFLDVQQVLVNGKWDWPSIAVFVAVIVIAVVLGAAIFQRRDISV